MKMTHHEESVAKYLDIIYTKQELIELAIRLQRLVEEQ